MAFKRRYLSDTKGLLIANMCRDMPAGATRPYFCPETKVPKILRSTGEMAWFEGANFKYVKFRLAKLKVYLLHCGQNLHVVLTLVYFRQTSADFSPLPRRLTSHSFCGINLTFLTKPRS